MLEFTGLMNRPLELAGSFALPKARVISAAPTPIDQMMENPAGFAAAVFSNTAAALGERGTVSMP
jgi:hypothetical protein